MNIKKYTTILFLCLVMILSVTACEKKEKNNNISTSTPLPVSVTFDAMYEFAKAVGQDKISIATIVPTGTEPHNFEPKASDIIALSKAKVFIYNGLDMEPWADKVISASENKDIFVVLASKGAESVKAKEEDAHEEQGRYDPHIWLSLTGAMIEVQNIANGLAEADPVNKEFYQKNAQSYKNELSSLLQEYQEKFSSVSQKKFVTGHAAFHYFCNDFGLEQNSVADVFAEGEPSSKQLSSLVEYCRTNNVTTIFAESMANAQVSETLANEVGAQVKTIYTMESQEDDLTYLERIETNCRTVYESLSSQIN